MGISFKPSANFLHVYFSLALLLASLSPLRVTATALPYFVLWQPRVRTARPLKYYAGIILLRKTIYTKSAIHNSFICQRDIAKRDIAWYEVADPKFSQARRICCEAII